MASAASRDRSAYHRRADRASSDQTDWPRSREPRQETVAHRRATRPHSAETSPLYWPLLLAARSAASAAALGFHSTKRCFPAAAPGLASSSRATTQIPASLPFATSHAASIRAVD